VAETWPPSATGCTTRWGRVGGMCQSVLTLDSNILSDIPTNSQLILRILRDAEHDRHPLPPVSAKPDEPASEDSEDDSGESSMKSKVGGRTKELTANVKDGTRTRLRRAWDRLGRVKEEVSSTRLLLQVQVRVLIGLGVCADHRAQSGELPRQSRGGHGCVMQGAS
jgi:hypothetical protein